MDGGNGCGGVKETGGIGAWWCRGGGGGNHLFSTLGGRVVDVIIIIIIISVQDNGVGGQRVGQSGPCNERLAGYYVYVHVYHFIMFITLEGEGGG